MRGVLLVGLLFVASMSGCAGKEATGETVADGTDPTGASAGDASTDAPTSAASGGTSGTNETDRPPYPIIKVVDNGTSLTAVNGSFAVTTGVNVTFDGSTSTDPDEDVLSFAWDFGDGSNATGATVSHAFANGSYVVSMTVDDGREGTAHANVTINATAPKPPFVSFTKSGSLTMTGNATTAGYWTGGEKQGDHEDLYFAVDEGAQAIVAEMTYTKAPSDSNNVVFLDFYLYDPSGARAYTRGSDPMPMTIYVDQAGIDQHGVGVWKAQASCYTCADTDFSFEVKVYYRDPPPAPA